ncbi:HNH endonuclease [Belliella pelovolcani]|uniref:HNH endonuclease n=1 Tax=Belliella pelovolcani TaxID=529505 RepID=UPI00391A69B6
MPIDYSKYHPKWRLISKLIRFRRDDNKCEWCGAENYQPHPDTGSKVILTVAHIDRDRNNNRFSNLAALCQRYHLNHDRSQQIRNRRYGREHKEEHQLRIFKKTN